MMCLFKVQNFYCCFDCHENVDRADFKDFLHGVNFCLLSAYFIKIFLIHRLPSLFIRYFPFLLPFSNSYAITSISRVPHSFI